MAVVRVVVRFSFETLCILTPGQHASAVRADPLFFESRQCSSSSAHDASYISLSPLDRAVRLARSRTSASMHTKCSTTKSRTCDLGHTAGRNRCRPTRLPEPTPVASSVLIRQCAPPWLKSLTAFQPSELKSLVKRSSPAYGDEAARRQNSTPSSFALRQVAKGPVGQFTDPLKTTA